MKRLIVLFVLFLLTPTLNASVMPPQGYEFLTVIGVPCGGDVPTDLCTSTGDAVAQTKTLLGNYSVQGWELVSTSSMVYAPGNEAVVFLLRRNPSIRVPVQARQYQIIMGASCGIGPNGLPFSRLCTGNGTPMEDLLNAHSSMGFKVVGTTSCTYRYEQGDVGMAVYLLLK